MDGIRAFAALSVLAFHIGNFSGANQYAWYGVFTSHLDVGVAIFFAISGFLLYRPFVAARHGGRQRSLGDYAIGRVLRLVPAYWAALTVAAIVPGLAGVFSGDWWMYYGLLQTYFPGHKIQGLPVAWSLVVEASFYALLPLYAFLLRGLARSPLRRMEVAVELIGLTALAAASVTAQQLMSATTILTTFDWFAGGMALAVVSVALARRPEGSRWLDALSRAPWLPWAGALACWLTLCLGVRRIGDASWNISVTAVLWVIIGVLALAPAVLVDGQPGFVARVLGSRTVAWLGLISYGIYLWHWPVLTMMWKHGWGDLVAGQTVLSYALIGTPLTIALAAASWYCVERPSLAARRRLRVGSRRVTPALDASTNLEAVASAPSSAAGR